MLDRFGFCRWPFLRPIGVAVLKLDLLHIGKMDLYFKIATVVCETNA